MILIDANLLIYAHISTFAQHEAARSWLDARLNGASPVGLAWSSVVTFLRVVTNPRVLPRPVSTLAAWRQARDWLACETAWTPAPTENHAEILGRFLGLAGIQANLVHDAHLAALAVGHGLTLCSTDGDFARFPDLSWTNPLA